VPFDSGLRRADALDMGGRARPGELIVAACVSAVGWLEAPPRAATPQPRQRVRAALLAFQCLKNLGVNAHRTHTDLGIQHGPQPRAVDLPRAA
jgi:hypothetical protein